MSKLDKNLIIEPHWPQYVICIWKHGNVWGLHDGEIHGYYNGPELKHAARNIDGLRTEGSPVLAFRSIEAAERYLEERPTTWTSGKNKPYTDKDGKEHYQGFRHTIEPICSFEHYEHNKS